MRLAVVFLVACGGATARAPVTPTPAVEEEPAPAEPVIAPSSPLSWFVDADGIGYTEEEWKSLPFATRLAAHDCYQRGSQGEDVKVECPPRFHLRKFAAPTTSH